MNLRTTNQQQWDFWMKGRLLVWGDDCANNHFLQASELIRAGKLPEASLSSEILSITSSAAETEKVDGMRICAATRSAQKGADVWAVAYRALVTTSKALPAGSQPLLRGCDEMVIVDLHVHSGDHALGSMMVAADGGPTIRHLMTRFKDKKSMTATEWSQKRVGAFLCNKWLKHEIKLFTKSGKTAAPLEADVTILDEVDKGYLKGVAGAWEAYEGTRAWENKLRVCNLIGSQVSLTASVKTDFSHAPPSIKAKFDELEKKHGDEYGSILVGKLTAVPGAAPGGVGNPDPRPVGVNTGTQEGGERGSEGSGDKPVVLFGPESEATLRSQYKIAIDCKSFDHRSVGFLMAENGHCFLLTKDDLILKKGTKLAGVGAGRMTQDAGDRVLPLKFPEGDRTMLEARLSNVFFCFCCFGMGDQETTLQLTCLQLTSFQLTFFQLTSFQLASLQLTSSQLASFQLTFFQLAFFQLTSFQLASLQLTSSQLASFQLTSFQLASLQLTSFQLTPFQLTFFSTDSSAGDLWQWKWR